ncbi:hypothetical protein [Specibacter sp. NPDC078692]|uniref:hypothetical protein n=1 Tax=Specibacter sp. NPDC078692 TaxID=3155818 RepID=UPI00343E6352
MIRLIYALVGIVGPAGGGPAGMTPLRPWQAPLATLAAKAVQPITARVVGRGFLPEKLHDGHLPTAPPRKSIM